MNATGRSGKLLPLAALYTVMLGLISLGMLLNFEKAAALTWGALIAVVGATAILIDPFYGLLMYLFMIYFRPSERYEQLESLRPALIVAISVVGVWFVQYGLSQKPPLARHKVNLLITLFFAQVFLSVLPASGVLALQTAFFISYSGIAVYLLLSNLVHTPQRLRIALWVMLLLDVVNALSAMFTPAWRTEDGRPALTGTLSDPNDLALTLVMLVPAGFALAASSRSLFAKIVAWVCSGILIAGVIETKSRGGMIGLAVVLVFEGWHRVKDAKLRPLYLLVALVLGFGVTIANNARRDTSGDEDSKEQRLGAWRAAFNVMRAHPLTGCGVAMFGDVFAQYAPSDVNFDNPHMTAHNSIALVGAEMGLVGLVYYLLLLQATWRAARRIQRRVAEGYLAYLPRGEPNRELYLALPRIFLGWLVPAVFLSQSYRDWYFLSLGLIIAADVQLRRAAAFAAEQAAPEAPGTWSVTAP